MLRGIHKASSTWLGKGLMAVVMGFLIISFAIWGIGDIFRGFRHDAAITIGGTKITVEQLREYYTDQLRQISRRAGRPIAPDQARALGIDRQLIGQLVAETTLDEQAKALRLGVSNAEIAGRITADPNFRGLTGQFDRARFEELIREAGFTESRYVEEQRRVMLRRQTGAEPGRRIARAGHRRRPPSITTRTRSAASTIVALGPAQAGDIPAPAPDVLEKYFEEHKVLFRAPEYRKVTLLSLSPADIAKPDAVSDADAKNYYEQHKAQYGTPEKREVRQIVYPNAEEANAAHERIAKGASFDDLVKDRGLKASDTDLGMVTKSAIIDPAVADAAFALKPGEVSQPINGRFGTVLLQIGKIEPGTQKTYEDVAAADQARDRRGPRQDTSRRSARQDRGRARGRRDAGRSRQEIRRQDPRASTRSTAPAAAPTASRSPTCRSGPMSSPPPSPPMSASITTPLQLPNGGYLYYDVTGITPSRERTLDEVKDQVAKRWRDDEIAKRLNAKTDDLLGKLKAGSSLAEVASDAGLKVETAQPACNAASRPASCRQRSSTRPSARRKMRPAVADGKDQTERYVFRVTEVADPKLDPASAQDKAIAASLKNSYADDITGEYIARLENEFGVDDQSGGDQPGHRRRHQPIATPCRSSRRKPPSPNATAAARRRWCGRRWSPIWKRRSRPISSSAAASR